LGGASRGAIQLHDGTGNTHVVATQASDTPTNGQVPTWKTGGTIDWETPGGGGAGSGLFVSRSAKTSAYTVVAGDLGYLIDCTSGTFSVSITAAATLTDGFFVGIINSGTGTITIDPNASETMRDVAGTSTTKTLARGDCVVPFCSGSEFYVVTATHDFRGTATTVDTPKAVSITNSTATTSTTTGALIVTGGAGIGGTLYINTISTSSGTDLNLSSTQNTTTAKPLHVTNATDATKSLGDELSGLGSRNNDAKDVIEGVTAAAKGGEGALFGIAKAARAAFAVFASGPMGIAVVGVALLGTALLALADKFGPAKKSAEELAAETEKRRRLRSVSMS
jgi:hypothetical protein